mgnify:CR=1 FL=1
MDFNLTEEHLMIQQAARDFAQNELLPGVIERDEKQIFPTEQVKKMGELGFMIGRCESVCFVRKHTV